MGQCSFYMKYKTEFNINMNKDFYDRVIAVVTGEIFLVAAFFNLDFSNYMPGLIAFFMKYFVAGFMAFIGGFLSVVGKDFYYFIKEKLKLWLKK